LEAPYKSKEIHMIKGMIAAVSAVTLAGAVLAQVSTGQPTSGTSIGVTPPPSTGVTTDTSRLATDCDQVAANARANQPPHSTMGCGKTATTTTTMGATNATVATPAPASTTTDTTASTSSTTTTTAAAPAPADTSMDKSSRKLAKADRN
jgi:hypothetical protein